MATYEHSYDTFSGQLKSKEIVDGTTTAVNLTSNIYFDTSDDSITGSVVSSVIGGISSLCESDLINDVSSVVVTKKEIYEVSGS